MGDLKSLEENRTGWDCEGKERLREEHDGEGGGEVEEGEGIYTRSMPAFFHGRRLNGQKTRTKQRQRHPSIPTSFLPD